MVPASLNPVTLANAATTPLESTGNQLIASLKSPSGLMLLGCLVAVVAFQLMGDSAKKRQNCYWLLGRR